MEISRAFFSALLASALLPCSAFALDALSSDGSYKGRELELEASFKSLEIFPGKPESSLRLVASAPMADGVAEIRMPLSAKAAEGVDLNALKKLLKEKASVKGVCVRQELSKDSDGKLSLSLSLGRFVCSFPDVADSQVVSDVQASSSDSSAEKPAASPSPAAFIPKEPGVVSAATQESIAIDCQRAIASVKGEKVSGAAFLALVGGRRCLVTCSRFLFDSTAQFVLPPSERLDVSNPLLSEDRDIAVFELPDETAKGLPFLKIEESLESVPHDSPLFLLTPAAKDSPGSKGLLKGVGPRNLEVSAEFDAKSLGSPIIDAKTFKVLGVAAYGTRPRPAFTTQGTRFSEVRRFGLRLDNLPPSSLQALDKKALAADVKLYNSVASMNELALQLLTGIYRFEGKAWRPFIDPAKFDSKAYPSIQGVLKDWNELVKKGALSTGGASKFTNSPESVATRFRSQISMPIANVKKEQANSKWIRSELEEQLELNKYYCDAFDGLRKDIEAFSGR